MLGNRLKLKATGRMFTKVMDKRRYAILIDGEVRLNKELDVVKIMQRLRVHLSVYKKMR